MSETLKELRLNLGWSMNELGRKAGLDVSYVSRAEKGKKITPATAKMIADALGLGYGKEIKVTDIEGLNFV